MRIYNGGCRVVEHNIQVNKKSLWKNSISFGGDPRGARTHDPNIKSVVLYLLS